MKALLDTHILAKWVSAPDELSPAQRHVLDAASGSAPLMISDITRWEIAALVSLGRLSRDRPLREWLEQAAAPPLVRRVDISSAVAAAVADLPDTFHRDPADRIIAATARVTGAVLLTNDARIRDAGIVQTV